MSQSRSPSVDKEQERTMLQIATPRVNFPWMLFGGARPCELFSANNARLSKREQRIAKKRRYSRRFFLALRAPGNSSPCDFPFIHGKLPMVGPCRISFPHRRKRWNIISSCFNDHSPNVYHEFPPFLSTFVPKM